MLTPIKRTKSKFALVVTYLSASAASLLGVFVLYGWYSHNIFLIQVHPSLVPMQFNTALCFFLSGIALIGLTQNHFFSTYVPSVLLTTISGLTLLEYVSGLNLGIDEWFIKHYITTLTAHPGRMALNTTLGFCLIGLSVLFASRSAYVMILGALVMGLGTVSLVGYGANLNTASMWGEETQMAVHTSVGFILLGVCVLALGYIWSAKHVRLRSNWFITTSTVISLVIVVSLWQALVNQEVARAHERITSRLDQIEHELSERLNMQIGALMRMVTRWTVDDDTISRESVIDDARAYLESYPLMQAIELLDKNVQPLWSLEQSGLFWSSEQRLIDSPRWLAALPSSFDRRIALSPALPTGNGQYSVLAAAPSVKPVLKGVVLGLLSIQRIVPVIDQREFQFEIFDDGIKVLQLDTVSKVYSDYAHTSDFRFHDLNWQLKLSPTVRYMRQFDSHLPAVVLVIGLLVTGIFQYVLFLRRGAHNKTRDLQKIERKFRNVVENSPTAIVMVDTNGQVKMVNTKTEEIFGYARSELVGQKVEILLPERFRQAHPKMRTGFFNEPSPRSMGEGRDLYARRKDGSQFPVEIGINPIDDYEGTMVLASIVDITLRKKQQHALAIHTAELERSNKALNDFAYVASHDLRAPLRGIHHLASWIEEEVQASVTDEVKEYFGLLKNRVLRLETLLDDLLAFSRAGRKHGDFKTVILSEWVREIFDILAPVDRFQFVFEGQASEITTLSVPLELILRNLLNNAIKHHNRPEGVVTFKCKEVEDGYEFSVADDGPGIAPVHQSKIFEIFVTLKPRDQVEGSGMGLAIVKRIVETYGGTIKVKSDGVHGTCFTFTWPDENKLRDFIND